MHAHQSNETAGAGGADILVWDAPVRVFHWLMVLCFAGAYLTAEEDGWRAAHITLGYTMAGLVAFRLLWGVAGTRHARFTAFMRGPRAVAAYLRTLLRRQPEHYIGHNPAGAVAIVALLALTAIVAATGWSTYEGIGGGVMEEVHEFFANLMLAVVGVHVLGVVVSGWLHRENLVRAMFSGRKRGRAVDAIRGAWSGVALLLLLAVLVFWLYQWRNPPAAPAAHDREVAAETRRDD